MANPLFCTASERQVSAAGARSALQKMCGVLSALQQILESFNRQQEPLYARQVVDAVFNFLKYRNEELQSFLDKMGNSPLQLAHGSLEAKMWNQKDSPELFAALVSVLKTVMPFCSQTYQKHARETLERVREAHDACDLSPLVKNTEPAAAASSIPSPSPR